MTKDNTKSVVGIARARLNSRPVRPFTRGAEGAKPGSGLSLVLQR